MTASFKESLGGGWDSLSNQFPRQHLLLHIFGPMMSNCAGSWRVWTEDNNLIKNKWDFCCSKWKRKEKKSICWRVWTEDNNLIKKNTRRDGGSTALYPVDTVFTVYDIKTALHCLNTVAFVPIYIYWNRLMGFWAKCWTGDWMGDTP